MFGWSRAEGITTLPSSDRYGLERLPPLVQMEGYNGGAGLWAVCAVTETHEVWCWGNATTGQLGRGPDVDEYGPIEALKLDLPPVRRILGGDGLWCASTLDDELWCWGGFC